MDSYASLKDRLYRARCEWGPGSDKYIVPRDQMELLITEPVVTEEIRDYVEDEKVTKYSRQICNCSKQLFSALAYARKTADIICLVDGGITDEDLPFRRNLEKQETLDLQCFLEGKKGKRIQSLENWTRKEREKFSQKQHMFTAPVFERGQHHDLDAHAILPFLDPERNDNNCRQASGGGYSKVFKRTIHPSHHNFWERIDNDLSRIPSSSGGLEERRVADKELISDDKKEFDKETKILSKLAPHPHLIQLYATYRKGTTWHLLFPCADANLREFWENLKAPNMDPSIVKWSLKQMRGLADGLAKVHVCKVPVALSPDGAGKLRIQEGGAILSVQRGEEWYGRHGDIKPENVLHFKTNDYVEDELGILKLADFGLGRFHGRDSRSNVDPKTINFSPTYEPPEVKLGIPVRREYDIWSLGCLYLEFATWLLKDFDAISKFSQHRSEPLKGLKSFSDDSFYSIIDIPETGEPDAEVRGTVKSWVDELRQEEKCSQFMHDLLDLIMEGMLRADSTERIKATELPKEFAKFQQNADEVDGYLLAPKPNPKPRLTTPDSTEQVRRNSSKPFSNKTVRFARRTGTMMTIP